MPPRSQPLGLLPEHEIVDRRADNAHANPSAKLTWFAGAPLIHINMLPNCRAQDQPWSVSWAPTRSPG
jgi:hypothetical protein